MGWEYPYDAMDGAVQWRNPPVRIQNHEGIMYTSFINLRVFFSGAPLVEARISPPVCR